MGGFWEFPGGKCEPGEPPDACLARELLEELGVAAIVHEEIYRTTYAYGDRVLDLRFFRCALAAEPRPLLGQEIRWVQRRELETLEFPPADAELVAPPGRVPLTLRAARDDQPLRALRTQRLPRRGLRPGAGPQGPAAAAPR